MLWHAKMLGYEPVVTAKDGRSWGFNPCMEYQIIIAITNNKDAYEEQ